MSGWPKETGITLPSQIPAHWIMHPQAGRVKIMFAFGWGYYMWRSYTKKKDQAWSDYEHHVFGRHP